MKMEEKKFWSGKWDKESFISFLVENEMLGNIIYDDLDTSTILMRVDNFEQMESICGHGRAMWAIAREEAYWNSYVVEPQREQYLWLDFSIKEIELCSKIAFTVDRKDGFKITEAFNVRNLSLGGDFNARENALAELGINFMSIIEKNNNSILESLKKKKKERTFAELENGDSIYCVSLTTHESSIKTISQISHERLYSILKIEDKDSEYRVGSEERYYLSDTEIMSPNKKTVVKLYKLFLSGRMQDCQDEITLLQGKLCKYKESLDKMEALFKI